MNAQIIELTQIIGNLATTVALGIASWQLYMNSKQRRAEHLQSLLNLFHSDSRMYDIYYKIEYGIFSYTSKHHTTEEEKDLDRLLGFFDNIARLYQMKLINKKDLGVFGYELLTILQNKEVNRYLDTISKYSQNMNRPNPFLNLMKLSDYFLKWK
ncbi:hypothetical protein [Leptospira jelokensis]|uniref:hypothetical protein n=1 Tax=Leptospira jelokensis TaxID=2484931 RepID=UPI0010913D59|nr:hypothetical protein [Leptospira jelokensis]TGM06414.1 hypothetical protein EHQ79_00190 [Leptospira jelokensis]